MELIYAKRHTGVSILSQRYLSTRIKFQVSYLLPSATKVQQSVLGWSDADLEKIIFLDAIVVPPIFPKKEPLISESVRILHEPPLLQCVNVQ